MAGAPGSGAVALAQRAAGADPAQAEAPRRATQTIVQHEDPATEAKFQALEADGSPAVDEKPTPAPPAPEAEVDAPETEADGDEATPDAAAAKPKRPGKDERRRRYEVEQQKRYQRSAKRFHEQAERMMAEADRKLEEANRKLEEHSRFMGELEEDHVTALSKRWGVPPEHVTARQADIQALDPRVQQMFKRQEEQLAELRRERDEERKRGEQQRQQHQEFEDISRDAQWLSVGARADYRSDYPSFFKLPEEERHERARRLVVSKVMAHRNGRDVDYAPDALLDELDRAARPLAERLRDDEPAQPSAAEGQGTRAQAKSPGRPTARAHAEPAGRMQQSEDDLRRAALRAARESRKAARG